MSKLRQFLWIVSGCLFVSFFGCTDTSDQAADFVENPTKRLEKKHLPAEYFFAQRTYPSGKFDLKAYEGALQSARSKSLSRQLPIKGFNEAWKLEGPGNIGARVNTLAIHPNDDQIIYAGFATGGVFKTTNGGLDWQAVFDQQSALSIGHILIDPNYPDTVFVGTGDPNITAYPSIGDGLYRSTNGGQTWEHLGLTDQRIISKVVVDHGNSDVIFAACMGLPFERNQDRGVYKSMDGGQNWSQVLLMSDSTGAIDLLMDPQNSNVLYAAGWDRIRNNFESVVSGFGAKIYKSSDGGQSWNVLSNGLPQGKFSRIGLAMGGTNGSSIFAMYVDTTFEVHGIYKSVDGGANWSTITLNSQPNNVNGVMGGMGWYFGQLRVHPQDENKLYVLGVNMSQSSTGGASWLRFGATPNGVSPHVDYHDLQFTSDGSIIVGTDGGLYHLPVTTNNWVDIDNIPATQFYRVAANPHQPDTYYGGAQDNGTVSGNAAQINNWDRVLGADGFQPVFHPTDPAIFYAETQFGTIYRTSDGGNRFEAVIYGMGGEERNWDMPYIMSPTRPDVLFAGTNRVYRASSPSQNSPWQAISGDLTNPIKTRAQYHTITTLDESALSTGLLYVGTSDGRLWRTDDDGQNWLEIHAGLPNRYITSVVASPDSVDHVFVGLSGYKDNAFTPLLYHSKDRGATWNAINGDLPDFAINDVVVLPGRGEQGIFVATDAGVYGSINGGANWQRLGQGLPFVPVYDIAYHPQNEELIAGTFARSIQTFPLDSIDFESADLLTVEGRIVTEAGASVQQVQIQLLEDGENRNGENDTDGRFSFEVSRGLTNLELTPSKLIEPKNGITSFDLVLLSKHILGIESLPSPYAMIAADVNRSGTLTAFDMLGIRKLILGLDPVFPDAESWRFVRTEHVFANPNRPFDAVFPESILLNDLLDSQTDLDFIAMKTGDCSGSADPTKTREEEKVESRSARLLQLPNLEFKAGESIRIPIYLNDAKSTAALQMTVQFDPAILTFESMESSSVDAFVNEQAAEQGRLPFSWINPEQSDLSLKEPLFYLTFSSRQNGRLEKTIALGDAPTRSVAYTVNGIGEKIALQFTEEDQVAETFKLQISPNPSHTTIPTQVQFNIPQATLIQFELVGLDGQKIWQAKQHFSSGFHQWTIPAELPAGTYYLMARSEQINQVEKLVKMNQ